MSDSTFIRVNGRSFHCERCGSNHLFHAEGHIKYGEAFACNGCGATYIGEKQLAIHPVDGADHAAD